MATLPTPYRMNRVNPGAPRPVSQVNPNAAGAVGDAIAWLGREVADIGYQIQDREDTAAAKERDAYVSDQIRDILHNPESGFTNMYGKNAVAAREAAFERLQQLRDSATKDLSKGAQRKLEARLQSRLEGAEQTIDTHTGRQRQVWLEGASQARIAAAEQDSLAGGMDITESFNIIAEELHQRARREGWDAAQLDLELGNAKSGLIYNQAVKTANNDPELALEYAQKNRDAMRPKDYQKLTQTLEPLAKEYKGRRLGAEAALVGVSGGYLSAIRSAESGGNDAARNPLSSATGRYQFTTGTWADLMARHPELGLTADGRLDPNQQELAIRAFTADNAKTLDRAGISASGANLYAAHFLGAGDAIKVLRAHGDMAMSDLVSSEVIAANPFLAGMTAHDFRRWAGSKGGGDALAYSSDTKSNIDALMAITDPDVRQAALQEYDLRLKVQEGQRKRALAAAGDTAFQFIEAGNSPDDLPLDVRQALGQDNMSSLRTYYGKLQDGPITTDPETYVQLRQMQANDPQGFRDLNMIGYVDKLSRADFKSLVDAQTAPLSDETRIASSTLMTVAKRQMEAAGVDTTPKPGSDAAAQNAAMQARLLKWQEKFITDNGRAPTQAEVDERIGQELVPVVLNPRGPLNQRSGYVFDTPDVAPEKLADAGLTIGGVSVPPEVVQEQIALMEAAGEAVTSDALIQRIAELMEGF